MKITFMLSRRSQLTLYTTLLQSHRQATQQLFSAKFLFGEANIVTAQVWLLFVQKRKPKMFGLKTLMERGISGKILTFVIHKLHHKFSGGKIMLKSL